jgi:hypothetical protein
LVLGTSYLVHLVTCLQFIVRLSATLGYTKWEVNIAYTSHVHRDTRQSAKYHLLVEIARCPWHCGYWCEAFHSQSPCCEWHEIIAFRASPLVLSMWLQTVKDIVEKVKMCRFSSGNWFFCTKFVHLAVAGERCNTVVHLQKKRV